MMAASQEKVSIIIRTLNEERWIAACLRSVSRQNYQNFEVIVVDNNSTDNTVSKAKDYKVKVISIDDFFPGEAINLGVSNSSGEILVCLSGHCIPTNDLWLENLIRNLNGRKVAGVYGRQEPLPFSSNSDKRDLMIAFGLDKKIQIKDSFFHNANSAFRRDTWKQFPFDETVTNVEDRIWAKKVIEAGCQLIYDPEASVYHYHGIHQDGNKERLTGVIKILEDYEITSKTKKISNDYDVCTIIPIKGDVEKITDKSLLAYTLESVKSCRSVHKSIVAADSQKVLDEAVSLGADHCLLRPLELSEEFIGVDEVLQYCLEELNKNKYFPDVVVYLSITNPFRPKLLLDDLINMLINGHYDTVMPSIKEYRSCWVKNNEQVNRVDEGFMPHNYKNPVHIGISGLGTATFSDVLNRHGRLGDTIGIIEIEDITCGIDLRDKHGKYIADKVLKKWWQDNTN